MKNYVLEYMAEKERADKLESILLQIITEKELKRSFHMLHLEKKNERLKHEIRVMQEKAEYFNKQLYATGLIVRCTGCEAGKPFDGENLTEDKVRLVEVLARRLRTWWDGHVARQLRELAQ